MIIREKGIVMIRIDTRTRAMTSPGKYIQGPGEIDNLVKYTSRFGEKVLVIMGGTYFDTFSKKLRLEYQNAPSKVCIERFDSKEKEVTEKEITNMAEKHIDRCFDVVVGIGGGKVLDIAKGVGNALQAALIIVPTAASSDAPTSAMSVLYHEDGSHSHEVFYIKNPDIVLVDTRIIVQAPVRLFVAGMADALATYIEVRTCMQSDAPNFVEGGCNRTLTGIAIAKLTYEVILQEGRKAKIAAEAKVCTKAFEDVVEANTLMSGLGFENNGSTGAHGFQVGLSTLDECKNFMHGELVAFGIVCQLMLENANAQEMETIIRFLTDVGLPVALADIGVINGVEKKIRTVAKSMVDSYHMQCEPFMVTEDMIYDTIIAADRMGNYYKSAGLAFDRVYTTK